MYSILQKLYENEILLSKYLFEEFKNTNSPNILNNKIRYKLNILLSDLISEINNEIDKLTITDNNSIQKFIQLDVYVRYIKR